MFLELIAVFVAGFAGAGLILMINAATGRRLPRWLMPVAAGAAMLGLAIANEYSWYPRTLGTLPEGLAVAAEVETRQVWRPWTYAVPFVSRFLAVDLAGARHHPDHPDRRIVEVYAFGRWAPVRSRGVAVDCATGRRADLAAGTVFGADGRVEGVAWREVGAADPILRAACAPAP